MARIIGTPGESAAGRAAFLLIGVSTLLILLVGVPSLWAVSYMGSRWGLLGVLLAAAGIAIVWHRERDVLPQMAELFREGINYTKGLRGEVLVHQELKKLSSEYVVFHDFHPIDARTGKPAKWNVDHIVVGPSGVFVLDAKYYRNPNVHSASANTHTRRNVAQVERNARELKSGLVRWSAGDLEKLYVVGAVVYTQPGAHVERLREGHTYVLPLRLLVQQILSHKEQEIDAERAGRIARTLYSQLGSDLRYSFKSEIDAYGELAKSARYAARDARLASAAEPVVEPVAPAPSVCPECGGKLVERIAKKGARTGKKFLGCENWKSKNCHYIFNLEE